MKGAKHTEASILDLIAGRYHGPEWVLIQKARDAAGFGASRTIDAVAFNVWPSRGLVLLGFEIKVSRGDWLRELAKPEKAEVAVGLVDAWYIVAPTGIVIPAELPKGWGLIEASAKRLTTTVEAERRAYTESVDRNLMAAMFKNLSDDYAFRYRSVVAESEVNDLADARAADRVERAQKSEKELRRKVEEFERDSGLSVIYGWDAKRVGEAVELLRRGGAEDHIERLQRIGREVEEQAKRIRESVKILREASPSRVVS